MTFHLYDDSVVPQSTNHILLSVQLVWLSRTLVLLRMDNSITLHIRATEAEMYRDYATCAGRVLPIYGALEAEVLKQHMIKFDLYA